MEQANKKKRLGACTDGELDVALIAYAHAERVPVLDHEAALRAAVDKVLELRRWARREERKAAAAAAQQPAAAAARGGGVMGKVKQLLPEVVEHDHEEPDAELEALQRALKPHLDEADRLHRLICSRMGNMGRQERELGVPDKSELSLTWLHARCMVNALRSALAAYEAHDAQLFKAAPQAVQPW